jgi:hypothetical protein
MRSSSKSNREHWRRGITGALPESIDEPILGVARRLNAAAAAIEGGQAFRFGPAPRPDELQEIKDVAVLPLVLSASLPCWRSGRSGTPWPSPYAAGETNWRYCGRSA